MPGDYEGEDYEKEEWDAYVRVLLRAVVGSELPAEMKGSRGSKMGNIGGDNEVE